MDELYSPQWRAFSREAALAGQLTSEGLTKLRKANYAATGLYSGAFFSLSIGMERMLKLIYLVDHAVVHGGTFPTEKELRDEFGHDIEKLFARAERVHERIGKTTNCFPIPETGIERSIIDCLSRFAKTTRYYNLDFLIGGKNAANNDDPIVVWWNKVANPVLAKHYSAKAQERDEQFAISLGAALEEVSMVRHTAEDGSPLTSFTVASAQTGRVKVVQKYGTFYAVRVIRFLYMLMYELTHEAHSKGIDIPALYEYFFPFMNEDSYLLGLKTFSPRGQ